MILVLLTAALALGFANLTLQIQLRDELKQAFLDTLEDWKQKEKEKIEAVLEDLPDFPERAQIYAQENQDHWRN